MLLGIYIIYKNVCMWICVYMYKRWFYQLDSIRMVACVLRAHIKICRKSKNAQSRLFSKIHQNKNTLTETCKKARQKILFLKQAVK